MIKKYFVRFTCALCLLAAAWAVAAPLAARREIEVYFTSPGVKKAPPGPEEGLAGLIAGSRESFHGAFYELSSERLIRLLIDARRRGVDVRLVLETDACGGVIGRLRAAGIAVVADGMPGLMHNKFAIIDGVVVWTGSYNLTPTGARENNNNAVLIRSRELALQFAREFREMFERGVFGNRREPGPFAPLISRPSVNVGGAVISAYFAPEDRVERIIRGHLGRASASVRFLAFSFTSNVIGDDLVALHRRGVSVSGVIERKGAMTAYSEYMKLRVEGVDVLLDGNAGAMHHKVIIIDGRIVITGSYNFTGSAERVNDENLLVIESAEVAAEFIREFERVRAAARSR